MKKSKRVKKSKFKTVKTGVIIVAVLAVGVMFLQSRRQSGGSGSQGFDEKAKGPETAKVRIIEYSDFQCPACSAAQPIIKSLIEDYGDEIQLIFRHFPLSAHLRARPAHQAAECANSQGKFWEYHDILFENQSDWSRTRYFLQDFLSYAKTLGLDLDVFASCMADEKITKKVFNDRRAGDSDRVTSTPTFFDNGKRLVGGVELREKGEEIIQKAIR